MKRAVVLAALLPALGGGAIVQGNGLYRSGQFQRAADAYRREYERGDTSAVTRYDLGTALLRLGKWDDARPHLEAAADDRRVPELRERALYNAGNADLEPVFRKQVTDEDQRRERLLRAIGHYKDALLATPADADAKWNLELAERLLRQEKKSGGGGGGANQQSSGGGGGASSPQQAQEQGPQPQVTPTPQLSQQAAEQILTGASNAEKDAQRQMLTRNRSQQKAVRDW